MNTAPTQTTQSTAGSSPSSRGDKRPRKRGRTFALALATVVGVGVGAHALAGSSSGTPAHDGPAPVATQQPVSTPTDPTPPAPDPIVAPDTAAPAPDYTPAPSTEATPPPVPDTFGQMMQNQADQFEQDQASTQECFTTGSC